ncbi:hypothetical protein SAMN02910298_02221 [Pseudobutyrivibrio sp. YE44]|uniref:hypothetical protein n=1 Tax=Pseudobutyrivibrio sp. YE44 TaxID=1520802 RepID=UPI000888EE7F|nr:hypothetical protein [Pseudobutyrivibrio sp. YE44]SDB44765.1 hypothetical protein SAMN02910298_02221 [Pseudobutyrivibrio sp. YE44]
MEAYLGLIGVVIGATLPFLFRVVERYLQIAGKLCINVKFVASKDTEEYPEVINCDGLVMNLPMWVEFTNSRGIAEIVRNLNIYAYYNARRVAEFVQIQKSNKYVYGNRELYSFVVPEKSVTKYDLMYMLRKEECEGEEIDELRIGYYDENNKFHEKKILNIKKHVWNIGKIEIKKGWITI